MKRTGEILKKAREDKGLSLHEVALFLKINSRVLQAIEEGDQTQLPARTFLRGFVQSYAKFLKLDPQNVLHVFSEETAPIVTAPPLVSSASVEPEPEQEKIPPQTDTNSSDLLSDTDTASLEKSILTKSQVAQDKLQFKTIAISIIGLLLVVVLYFTNSLIKKYKKEAQVNPVESISNVETTATEMPNIDAASDDKSSQAVIPSNDSSPAAETPSPTLTPIAAAPAATAAPAPLPGHNTTLTTQVVSPVTISTPTMETKPEQKIIEKPSPQKQEPLKTVEKPAEKPVEKPSEKKEEPKMTEGKLIEVIVEATDSVEIEYSSAKSNPQKLVLKADQIHTFKSRSGVRLKISNGGAVNIIKNGQDLGAPGAAGQPIQLTY